MDTLPALEKLLTTKIEGLESRFLDYVASHDKASQKAEIAIEKRFDSVNEFRQALADQSAGFLTRNEYDIHHTALSDKVSSIEKVVDENRATNKGIGMMISIIVSAVAFCASISSILYVFIVFSRTH